MAAGGPGRRRRRGTAGAAAAAAVAGVLAAWAYVAAASPPPGVAGSPGAARSRVQVLGAANWSLVLRGQWMVQFYAPWCSACQRLESTWENFAKESELLDLAVGKVDVTEEPGLSGRFFVTTLPTIYHAKDGVFRRYRGSRTVEDLQGYILERKWEAVEPVAGWKSPSSIMMNGMAGLFRLSGWIRQIHSYFTDTLGIHVWGSYAIFILATLLIGLTLGLILVLISDCLCPAKSRYRDETSVEVTEKENVEQTTGEEQEDPEELSADELEGAENEKKDLSDGEDGAHSSTDGSEEDSAVDEGSGTEEIEDISEQLPADPETQSSVRQRKIQEADSGP